MHTSQLLLLLRSFEAQAIPDEDDRDVAAAVVRSQGLHERNAASTAGRQVDIDHVGARLPGSIQAFRFILRHDNRVALAFQAVAVRLPRNNIVIDEQRGGGAVRVQCRDSQILLSQ